MSVHPQPAMMLPSHLAATLILGFVLARWFPFDARAWILALAFGVAIDVDHLFQIPRYLATQVPQQGLAALNPAAILHYGAAWQGVFHNPLWGTVIVLAACLATWSLVPLVFWGLHMVLDFVVARHYVVFGSPTEFGVLAGMLAVLAALAWWHHRSFGEGAPFASWARGGVASTALAAWNVLLLRR